MKNVLQRIYGPVCVNGLWIIRTNAEIADLHKELKLVIEIKIGKNKMDWAF